MGWLQAAAIGADIAGGLLGHSAQEKANKANVKMNRENRAWMETMANTEYQRTMEDMKAAGLNPMLAATQGGATTPQNSAATVQPEDAVARGVNSAASKMLMGLEVKQREANIAKTLEDIKAVQGQTEVSYATAANLYAGNQGIEWQAQKVFKELSVIDEELKGKRLDNQQKEQIMGLLIEAQQLANQAAKIGNADIANKLESQSAGWREWLRARGIEIPAILQGSPIQIYERGRR